MNRSATLHPAALVLVFLLLVTGLPLHAFSRMPPTTQWSPHTGQPLPDKNCRANCPSTGSPAIHGQIRFPDHSPAPNIYVQLEPAIGGGIMQSATTDSTGTFSFINTGVGTSYTLVVNLPGYAPVHRLIQVTSMMTEVDITLVALHGTVPPNRGALVSVRRLRVPAKALHEYQAGVREMNRRNYRAAANHFRKAVHRFPSFAAGYRKLGIAYASLGRFAEARRAIGKAFQLDKNDGKNYALLGFVYLEEKQLPKAKQALEQSIHLSKDNWLAQLELGRLLYEENAFAAARPHLETARTLRPQLPSAHLLLYDDLIRLRQFKAALTEMEDFLARFPNDPEAARLSKLRSRLAASASHQH